MIEIVYKEEKKQANGNEEFFCLPKNIRQIGEIRGARKIYMEDYVYTFLKRMSTEKETAGHAGILFGRYKWTEGNSYLFIQSAMELQEMEVNAEHMQFTDKVWGEVHDTVEKYFKGQEILGWVLSLPGFNFEISDLILKTHLNHFAGSDKVLLMMEPTEKDEAFYCYESGRLRRESGYYIYYEKNEAMQEYMIAYGKNRSIEETEQIPDRAVSNFRKALEQKQGPKGAEGEKPGRRVVYGLAACAAMAAVAVGFTYASDANALPGILGRFNQDSKRVEETASIPSQDSSGTQTSSSQQGADGEIQSQGNAEETSADVSKSSTSSSSEGESENKTSKEQPTAVPSPTVSGGNTDTSKTSAGVKTREYIVKKGDTLSKICMAAYGNMSLIQQICDLNHLDNAELIYEGQKLVLPQ